MVVAVNRLPEVRTDELLAVCGWKGNELSWFNRGWADDPLLQQAAREGVAVSSPSSPVSRLPQVAQQHAVLAVLREPVREGRLWQVVFTRRGSGFSDGEIRRCGLMLQQWHGAFVRPAEPGMGRAIIGLDGRVLGADLQTEATLIESPQALQQLMDQLLPIIRQRYPEPEPDQAFDATVRVAGRPTWARLRKRHAAPIAGADHWYLETRPLEEGELPEVGLVEDDRVARAIGYLDTHFAEAPSLAQLAKSVHMSRFHFHRLFTQQVAVSPKQYLLRRQLQMARWLLRTRVLPVSTIASACGFATHGHFTSTFHRVTGESPSAYRDRSAGAC